MELHDTAASRLQRKLDAVIEEALKRHGHEFKTRADLATFIKEKCQAITKDRTTVYYANGVAFLYYKEEPSFKVDGLTATASLGSYAFIDKNLKRWQIRNAARNARK